MLTAVILTHNSAGSIGALLENLQWAAEILVMDDDSTDATVEIAKAHGARVVIHSLKGDFARARNTAMGLAKRDWVLFVDSDELLDQALIHSVKQANLHTSQYAGYRLPRVDQFWNQHVTRGEVWTAAHRGIIRLVHRTRGEWRGKVHEEFVPTGMVTTLAGSLIHHPHQSINDFLADINVYSTIRASELTDQSRLKTTLQMIFFPPAKFFFTYVICGGWLDGAAGFAYSFMMSFHSFLVRAKVLSRDI
ncbi:MAG: glycosyltransferase family 2 protein [bacterium]